MTQSIKRALIAGGLLIGLTPGGPQAWSQPLSQAQTQELFATMEAVFNQQQWVGLQAAVFDGEKVVAFNQGYADLEHEVPVTTDTRFEVASVTKAFTGLAALQLEAAAKMDMDAPIQTYVPEFPEKPEGTITPNLLSGILSGIRHYEDGERTPKFYATHYDNVATALELFKDDPLVATPGAKEHYSSYGYNLLAAAIQAAAGERFQDYIQRAILDPLQMENTGFVDVRVPMKNRSRTYSYVEPYTREVLDHLRVMPTLEHSYNMGGGNMYSTAEDLVRFGRQFLQPGFISEDIYEKVYQPHVSTSGVPTGASDGWFMLGMLQPPPHQFVGAIGSYPGTLAMMLVYPELDVVIAMTTNTWGKDAGTVLQALPGRWTTILAEDQ